MQLFHRSVGCCLPPFGRTSTVCCAPMPSTTSASWTPCWPAWRPAACCLRATARARWRGRRPSARAARPPSPASSWAAGKASPGGVLRPACAVQPCQLSRAPLPVAPCCSCSGGLLRTSSNGYTLALRCPASQLPCRRRYHIWLLPPAPPRRHPWRRRRLPVRPLCTEGPGAAQQVDQGQAAVQDAAKPSGAAPTQPGGACEPGHGGGAAFHRLHGAPRRPVLPARTAGRCCRPVLRICFLLGEN